MRIFIFLLLPTYLLSYPATSPTELHATQYQSLIQETFSTYRDDPLFNQMIEQIIAFEKKYTAQDYYTFIHAQRKEYLLAQLWYTWLWELKYQYPINDFIFLQWKHNYTISSATVLQKNYIPDVIRPHLLFMNYALFANAPNPHACCALLMVNNKNLHTYRLHALEDIFKMYGYEQLYCTHKQEFDNLVAEYNTIAHYGSLIGIAIPRDIIHHYVYCTYPGGYPRSVTINTNTKPTNNMTLIMETLAHHFMAIPDHHTLEFCLIMTHDAALNPMNGIKIFPIPGAHQPSWDYFDNKQKILLKNIKKTLNQYYT